MEAFLEQVAATPMIAPKEAENNFAFTTMKNRIPEILLSVIEVNKESLNQTQLNQLHALHQSMKTNGPIPLIQTTDPLLSEKLEDDTVRQSRTEWNELWQKWPGAKWLEAPWFYAESYFFRLVLEYTGYFKTSKDPFLPMKEKELQDPHSWSLLSRALETTMGLNSKENLLEKMKFSLWGNKADACFRTNESVSNRGQAHPDIATYADLLLINDSQRIGEEIQQLDPMSSISFINDNCGAELIMDLCLADELLSKKYPTYVSDATIADVQHTIETLAAHDNALISQLGQRLQQHQSSYKFHLTSHPFWNSHRFFWEFPPEVQHQLRQSRVVFIKGDANYRRLLGDREWPLASRVDAVVPYFPSTLVSLRTLKSDPIVGISPTQQERLNAMDPLWRVNGKRGIIQSVSKT